MKLKNSRDNLSLKILFPVMYGVTLLLIIVRTFILTRYTDSETGFLTGGEIVYYAFLAVMLLTAAFFVVASYLSSEGKEIEVIPMKNRSAGVATVVLALSLIYDFASSFVDFILLYDEISVSAFYSSAELFKVMMSTGTLPSALQSLFAVISAIYFFILAKNFFKGVGYACKHKYMALAPVAWGAFKIITRFVKQISYIKVSDLFLELIMLAFMVLFFVALAQVTSGVYCDASRWRITALGLSGALVSFSTNIPRLVLTVFANDFVNQEYPFNFADTAFAFFAVVIAAAAVRTASEKRSVSEKGE